MVKVIVQRKLKFADFYFLVNYFLVTSHNLASALAQTRVKLHFILESVALVTKR